MMTSYRVDQTTRRFEMEPMSYGEMIASHLDDLRREAARERAARRASPDGFVSSLRVSAGRFLVSAGERVAGCAELARGEIERPQIKVAG
jgi:hypothetical protein